MPTTYPETWLTRVQHATKLVLDPLTGTYYSPIGDAAISREAIVARTEAYLKAEAARQRRRLTKDDERVCREFVLLAANWPANPATDRPSRAAKTGSTRRRHARPSPN
jgi:hypothetical protein